MESVSLPNHTASQSQIEAIRILLVDDREDHFIMTRRIFASIQRGKFTVDWAGKYAEALEAIQQKNHDVYLIDYYLGVDSGIELVREARRNGCRAPMIVFTSSSNPDADVEALNAGATDYLTKGRIDAVLLERSVRYAIRHTQQLEALRKSEEALRRSEEQLRLAVDAAAMGTMDWDIDSNQISYGGIFEQLFNIASATTALSFESFLQQVHPQDRASLQEAITSAMVDGSHFAVEVRVEGRRNGERWVAARGQVYLDAGGRAVRVSGVVQDVTDRKLIEQERLELLRRERAALRASEEANDMKVHFLAMVSHELRTPLTSIKGFTSTLLAPDMDWDANQYHEYLAIIDEEAEKLTELIGQLMDISRLQAGAMPIEMQPCYLTDIIKSATTQLDATLQDHHLAIDISPDMPPVLADTRRIEQVVVNLVQNAAKYSPAGSEIHLMAYPNTDEQIEIAVRDRGMGIPPDHRERVFEPFHQVVKGTNSQKGAGLGLAICKGLVEAHGGRIWIQDRNEPGTTILFTLPIAQHH